MAAWTAAACWWLRAQACSWFKDAAVVLAHGEGSRVRLEGCKIESLGGTCSSSDCVLARRGGRAELVRCDLSGASGSGLRSEGAGSYACAARTTSQRNGCAGFAAELRGRLEADECTAQHNDVVGFLALQGGVTDTSRTCVALGNTMHGFAAIGDSSRLTAGAGCRADRNGKHGFLVSGTASQLDVGPGCKAERNGITGFSSVAGGRLQAGDGCEALHNADCGFAADGQGSVLVTGPQCRAKGNKEVGFMAGGGASVELGEHNEADVNGNGIAVQGAGSKLSTQAVCCARGNKSCGFKAVSSGVLEAGERCYAAGNADEGYVSSSGTLVIGAGSQAHVNMSHGFYATDGGMLDGSAGKLHAKGNGGTHRSHAGASSCHGFFCEGLLSRLLVGPCSKSVGSMSSGFAVSKQGDMIVASGAKPSENMDWGFYASGRRSVIQVEPDARLEGNHKGGIKAEAGGKVNGIPKAK
ncbi:hypothetical protein GPECTOR_13g723 [Gonium pectorale]|uniref:Right handed beta helix domain-containing protein n=1 Tax=Gonium pectorale TaxID=33097 RepID=A0A150GMY9_GONPE|nr:hypothetical protein GPECTOR_13g723 [Gonium pectorale]|eukprot:KXZ51236.1 hypothetical protein GPECTOR_13g723 [Gonium pectorale]